MQLVKNENRSQVLYMLNREGALSRKQLASGLGLTAAAVTKICSGLIDGGYIKETGESAPQGKSGRREILLSLCLEDKAVLGINAEQDVITLSVSKLDGTLLGSAAIPFTADISQVITKTVKFAVDNTSDVRLTGAGICVIGSDNNDDFGVWKDDRLKERFELALDIPVVVENNVKAFVESELIYGEIKNPASALFLKWGPGIGSAIVSDGKVFASSGTVAEIGHYIVNPGGVRCRCGRYGCLETEASEDAILKELNSKKPLDELLKNCDNNTMNIIDHKIDMVALAVTNTATILNTENIVFFGTMFKNEIIAEKLKKQCLRYNKNLTVELINKSSLNDKSSYIGCSAICAKHFFFEADGR